MCNTCGCNVTEHHKTDDPRTVEVLEGLLADNDHQATHNRAHFNEHGLLAVNLMSSPGAGKTALLEATIDALKNEFSIAVVEGDLETENDAERIRAKGVPAHQISTGTACHLDAHMVHDALHHMPLASVDILFIENVGNLVCPASFDLGQHQNVVLLSVTEGDDKPVKYPVMFRAADAVLVTKTDLLPYMDDFAINRVAVHMRNLASDAPIIPLSAKKNLDMNGWTDWLRKHLDRLRADDKLRNAGHGTAGHTHGRRGMQIL